MHNSCVEPTIIEYPNTPPSRARLVALIGQMKIPVRELLAKKATPYGELQLDNPRPSDNDLIKLLLAP